MENKPTTDTAAAVSLEVFARRSSGVVRDFSLWDAMWYGVLASGFLFGLLYMYPIPQLALPGLNMAVSIVIAIVLLVPVIIVYAGLSSAIPRMGGDYLYQSRMIHPSVGFSFSFAWEVFIWVTFTTGGAIVVATMGFQPLLYNLGLHYDSPGLMSAANWFGSPNGIFVMAMAVVAVGFVLAIAGLRAYRTLQRFVLLPLAIISGITLIVLLARGHTSFVEHFNSWNALAVGDTQTYDSVVQGGPPVPSFSLKNTLLMLSLLSGIWYVVYSAQGLMGEVKNANSFRRVSRLFAVGGLFSGILGWLVPVVLFISLTGNEFMYSYGAGYYAGTVIAPAGVNMVTIAMMMTSNPVVLVLLVVGFISQGFYFSTCAFLNMTRVLGAMSLDRVIPTAFSKISRRFHAPVNAALLFLTLAVIVNLLYRFVPSAGNPILLAGPFTSTGVLAITGLAALLFPYRARTIYEASPVGRYRFLGVPLISWMGGVLLVVSGAVTVSNLIFPELGLTSLAARLLLLISVVCAFVWFWGFRAYQKRRKGINIDLAFTQVPPD